MGDRRGWRLSHAVLCLVVLLGGCDDADPEAALAALRADPLAAVGPSQAVGDAVETSDVGSTGTKPTPSTLRRSFDVQDGEEEEAVAELADAAVELGWEVTSRSSLGVSASKRLGDLFATARIAGFPETDRVSVVLTSRG